MIQPSLYAQGTLRLIYNIVLYAPCRGASTRFVQYVWRCTWQELSFGGYYRDDAGKLIVGDGGLNGVELGPAIEITTGWKPVDRLATYTGGSGTDTLSFLYIVQKVGPVDIYYR